MRVIATRAAPQLVDCQKSQTKLSRLRLHSRLGSLEHRRCSCRRATAASLLPQPLDILGAPDASVGSQCYSGPK